MAKVEICHFLCLFIIIKWPITHKLKSGKFIKMGPYAHASAHLAWPEIHLPQKNYKSICRFNMPIPTVQPTSNRRGIVEVYNTCLKVHGQVNSWEYRY